MRDREQPSLRARLLFKAIGHLSGRGQQTETAPAVQRRQSASQRATGQYQSLQNRGRNSSYEAPPLIFAHLPPRARCLTPCPLERQPHNSLYTDEQSQSILFKLPGDVRLKIFEEAVGKRLLHKSWRRASDKSYSRPDPDKKDLIQLLQTCRRIYVDAVQVLYSSNVFEFDGMESLISMSCAILPHRFDTIQSVRLDFRFDLSGYFSESTCYNDWPRWERTWRILESMEALQRLWLRISWPKEALYDSEEKKYLEPLFNLTNLKTFKVSLPPLRDEEKGWGKNVPFEIVRRSTN